MLFELLLLLFELLLCVAELFELLLEFELLFLEAVAQLIRQTVSVKIPISLQYRHILIHPAVPGLAGTASLYYIVQFEVNSQLNN